MRIARLIVCLSLGVALSACDALRAANSGPDEFAVVTRAPLSMPPDFGLRPPRPGAVRPNETSPRDDARSKLLRNLGNRSGRGATTEPQDDKFTGGESALLKRADALNPDPEIRYIVERESGRIKEDDSLVDALVFWRKKTPPKSLVDPKLEAERLRDNAALGKPATAGKTPTVEK